MDSLGAWRQYARSLEERGEYARAFEVLKAAADAGESLAFVEIANLKWQQSAYEETQGWLDRAEKQVAVDDWETHYSLHWAYARGMGSLDPVEKSRRAFEHLITAAEWGHDPRLKLAVAVHYRDGQNMVEVDTEAAEKWFSMAAASKNPVAVAAHKTLLRAKKRSKVRKRRDA